MYNQFCKNLLNYIHINSKGGLRLDIAKDILSLTDISTYQKHKEQKDKTYEDIGKLIYSLEIYQKRYPRIESFIWELWAYGFDPIETNIDDADKIPYMDEKAELIDLLLHTHYFA